MMRARFLLSAVVLTLLACAAPLRAGEIALQTTVRLDALDSVVHLRDVAKLTGEAEQYADVVLMELPAGQSVAEIELDQVRRALDEAGVHWGRTNLIGRRIVVRRRPTEAAVPLAMTGASIRPAASPRRRGPGEPILAAELAQEQSIGGALVRWLSRSLAAAPADLRLSFRDDDLPLLDMSLADVQVEIEPVGDLSGHRSRVRITQWRDRRPQERSLLTMGVEIRTSCLVAARELPREHTLTSEDLRMQDLWLPPGTRPTATLADAAGRVTATSVTVGHQVRPDMLEREIVIRRGEPVMVRCLVGGLVIKVRADALDSGAAGEDIELRKVGERSTFMATITGPGQALIDLSK